MLTDILLVIRNNQGVCEENFVTTVDEILADIFQHETKLSKDFNQVQLNQYLDSLKKQIVKAEPFEWAGSYYAYGNDSYDMRLCQGPQDLLKFLSGRYNDSIEAMEARNPGSAGFYNFWNWENDSDRFSVLAVKSIAEYSQQDRGFAQTLKKTMPDFPFNKAPNVLKHARLADVILNAEKSRNANLRSAKRSLSMEL